MATVPDRDEFERRYDWACHHIREGELIEGSRFHGLASYPSLTHGPTSL